MSSRYELVTSSNKAEKGVLGSLLIEGSQGQDRAIGLVIGKGITSEFFFDVMHCQLFELIISMYRKGKPIDLISVGEQFNKDRNCEFGEGYSYCEELIDNTPTAAHVEYYIEALAQAYSWRLYSDLSFDLKEWISNQVDPDEMATKVLQAEQKISKLISSDSLKTNSVCESADRLIGTINLGATVIQKIPSSINTIRNRIKGYPVGRMTVIASRPGVGKTSLACTETLKVAMEGRSVSVLTFEMTEEEYTARMACIHARVGLEDYVDGKLSDAEKDRMIESLTFIKTLKIHYNEKSMNIEQVLKWITTESKRSSMIIIDHFLLIKHMSKKGERESSIYGGWSRKLRDSAKQNDVALLVLSQLKRAQMWKGKAAPPTKNDLKETGCLEEDCYLLLLLDDVPVKKDDEVVTNYRIIIDKHRNGWKGICPVNFTARYAMLEGIGEN